MGYILYLVSMQAMEEQGHFQLPGIVNRSLRPCIIMLKHEVMAAEKRHDNGPQVLITVSQIAINKMQVCSLSVAYVCPYHNLTSTRGSLFTTLTSENRSPT
jgi:hypothetical protein